MNDKILLRVEGEVERPTEFGIDDLADIDTAHQIDDVTRLGAKRPGEAVMLRGILDAVGIRPSGKYLGLHSETDDFHASIPLEPVLNRACLIYRCQGQVLDVAAGGPLRFFVPDHAECHTDEIDEFANVKFVERLEITSAKGFDNRPVDDAEHEKLHRGE